MGLRERLPKLSADKILYLRVCSMKFAHCRLWEVLAKTHKHSIYCTQCADTGLGNCKYISQRMESGSELGPDLGTEPG
jgi:hypothetical protein